MRPANSLVVAGIAFAETAFLFALALGTSNARPRWQRVKTGAGLLQISGSARAILSADAEFLILCNVLSGCHVDAGFVAEIKRHENRDPRYAQKPRRAGVSKCTGGGGRKPPHPACLTWWC